MTKDYMTRWKENANALHQIFSDYAQKVYAINQSHSYTEGTPEEVAQKKVIIAERDAAIKVQQALYRKQEEEFIA